MPEIPFPNDLATVMDLTSPTGKRLNIRDFAPTVFEESVRGHLNGLDGFGTFATLSVSFDSPLDLNTLKSDVTRMGLPGENTVLLVDLGATEPFWGGRFVPLDTRNNANFPNHIKGFPFPAECPFGPYTYDSAKRAYYQGKPVDEQLLFRPDNAEDLDGDGTSEILTLYEKETNTLLLRPLIPLRQATEYLVVLTRGLKGKEGESVRSPWPQVAHATQTKSLAKALPYLAAARHSAEDVAFAWTFTTQSVTPVLEAVRDGMDGKGRLGFLAQQLPFKLDRVSTVGIQALEKKDNPYLLDTEVLNRILSLVVPLVPDLQGAPLHFDHVDYLVLGSFQTPNFRATQDETFDIDLHRGTATLEAEEVPFVLCVPKATARHRPPFPVTLYCHGNQSIRFEALASADYLASQGIAVMGIDAVGHGPIVSEKMLTDELEGLLRDLGLPEESIPDIELVILKVLAWLLGVTDPGNTPAEVLERLLSVGFLNELMVRGRAIDLSGDGYPDNGANFWTADTFETRDVVRQTAIDLMYLLRILKSLDPRLVPTERVENPRALSPEEAYRYLLAGDFNMDNVLDVGGLGNDYYQSGISLGGIVSGVMLGVEPGIRAGVPVVPGGGLTDVMLRSDLKDVMYRIYYEVLGPVILGLPETGGEPGTVVLRFQNNLREIPAGVLRVEPGGSIHGVNPSNGEEKWVSAGEADGRFVIGVACDEGGRIQLTSYAGDGRPLDRVELVSPLRGFGLDRNTPRFRRFVGLAQITIEPGDPINYAPRWFMDPLPGAPQKNVLQLTDPGDLTVPINNQIALARAGGLLGDLRGGFAQALARNDSLIERGVLLGHDPPLDPRYPDYVPFPLFDVDDRDGNNWTRPSVEYPGFSCEGNDTEYCRLVAEDRLQPFAPIPAVETGNGRALVRFPFAKKHEFFGIPKGPAYAIYTGYAQNQAGSFLGHRGEDWREAWDCSIVRSTEHPEETEYGPDCPEEWRR